MANHEPVSKTMTKGGGLSFVIVAILHIVSIPLAVASSSILAPSSQLTAIQVLPGLSLAYGTFVGTVILLELFAIVAFAILYFVLRRVNQFAALAGVMLVLAGIIVVLAGSLPMRYAQINMANYYASATSDAQRTGFLAAYQLAFDLSNITALIELVMDAIGFFLIGYAMVKSGGLFSRPVSYLALLSGVLITVTVLVSWIPAAFGVMFVIISLVLAAFGGLTGMRLYKMSS